LLAFLQYYGKPLLVPSANKSNETPATSIKEVFDYFEGEIEYCVLGKCTTNLPSTIIQVDDEDIKIIRKGPILEETIREAIK
jgi:L-threonylcarbamoyladenylate synthase